MYTYGCSPICVNGVIDMAAYEFQKVFLDALIEQAFVRDDEVKTMADAWVRLGQRMGPAVQKLADSSSPRALDEIPTDMDLDSLITMEEVDIEWDGMVARGSGDNPGVSMTSDGITPPARPTTTQNLTGATSASSISAPSAALMLSLTSTPAANNNPLPHVPLPRNPAPLQGNPAAKPATSKPCDGAAEPPPTDTPAGMPAANTDADPRLNTSANAPTTPPSQALSAANTTTTASIPGDEDAKSDTNSDMDRSSDPDADADGEVDANGDSNGNANGDVDANAVIAYANAAPNARANDNPMPDNDSESDLDLACAPDSDADVRNAGDASVKAVESDSSLSSAGSSFPSPVRKRAKKGSTHAAASTQKSSRPADSDADMSDGSASRLKNAKARKGKAKDVGFSSTQKSSRPVESDADMSDGSASRLKNAKVRKGKAKDVGFSSTKKPSRPVDSDADMSDGSASRLKNAKARKGKAKDVGFSLKRKRSLTPQPAEPVHLRALSLAPLLKKQRIQRSQKNARPGAMSAAFPVNPPVKVGSMRVASLLKPSTEPATAQDGELHPPLPPRGPPNFLNLQLPTAVYDVEEDDVKMELRPFQFPYAAQVRNA